jgi:hypothetical protein
MPKRWLFLLLLLPAACTRTPSSMPPTPLPAATPPAFVAEAADIALPQLVAAEREASRAGDLALLTQLWAPGARIVDGRGTAEIGDDFIWSSREAILDRYRVAVFPSPPPPFDGPPELAIAVDGDRAEATLGQDHWVFLWQEGRWWAVELAYSMAGDE